MGAGAPGTVRNKSEWQEQVADSARLPDSSVVTAGNVEIREKPYPSSRSESMRENVNEENGPGRLRPVPVRDGGGGDDDSLSVFSYDNMLDDFADDDASIIATTTSPKKKKKKKNKNSSHVEYLEVQNLEISRVDVELRTLNELNKNASRSDVEIDYESTASEINRQHSRTEDVSDLDCDLGNINNSVGSKGPGSVPRLAQVSSSGMSDEDSEERDAFFDKPMASPVNTRGVMKGVGPSPMARHRTRNSSSGFHAQPRERQNTGTLLVSSPGYTTAATTYDMATANKNFDDLQKTKMWSYAQNAQLEREVEVLQRQLAHLEALERGMGFDTSQEMTATGHALSASEYTYENQRRSDKKYNNNNNKRSHVAVVPALSISGGLNALDAEGSSKIFGSKVSTRAVENESTFLTAMTGPIPPPRDHTKSSSSSTVRSGSLRLRQPRVHTHLLSLRDNDNEGILSPRTRKQLSKIDGVSEQDVSANSESKDDYVNSARSHRSNGALGSSRRSFGLNANANVNMTGTTNPTSGEATHGALGNGLNAAATRPFRKNRTEEVMSGNTSGRDDNERRERGEKADKSDRKEGLRRPNAHRRDLLSVEREQLSKEQRESEARADGTGSAYTNNNTNAAGRNSAAANVIAHLEEKRLRALGSQGATLSDYNVTENKGVLSGDDGNGNEGRSALSMLRRRESRKPRNLVVGPRNPRHRAVSGSGEDKSDSDAPADEVQQYSARLLRPGQGHGHSLTGHRQQIAVIGPSGERSRETTDDESKAAATVETSGRKRDSPYRPGFTSHHAIKIHTAAEEAQSDQEDGGVNKSVGRSIRGVERRSRRLSMPAGSTILTTEDRVEQVLVEAPTKEVATISHAHSHSQPPYKPSDSLPSSPRGQDFSSEVIDSARGSSLGPRRGGGGGEGKEGDAEDASSAVEAPSSHHRRRPHDDRRRGDVAPSGGFLRHVDEEKSDPVSDTKNPSLHARRLHHPHHQQSNNASVSPEVVSQEQQKQRHDSVTVPSSSPRIDRHDENKREGHSDEDRDRDRRQSLHNKEVRKRASRIDRQKKQTNESYTSADIEVLGWSPSLENRWCEVCLLLRKAIATEDDMLYTVITAEAGMMFFDQLDSVSKSLQVMRGTLSRWLLPFDNDTRLDGQCSTPHSVAQHMPEILRGRLSEREVHYLVTGLNSVRKLVRIKIADDNDLEQARQALKTTVDFFKELQVVSITHELTAFKLLEKRLMSGM